MYKKKLAYFMPVLTMVCGLSGAASAAPLNFAGQTVGWTDNLSQDWLRLDVKDTSGNNFLQTATYAELSAGISFADQFWRLATVDEVLTLWNEFESAVHDSGHALTRLAPTSGVAVSSLMDAFGSTHYSVSGHYIRSWGVIGDPHSPGYAYTASVLQEFHASTLGTQYDDQWDSGDLVLESWISTSNLSAWMIEDTSVSNVPLPAGSLSFLSGLGGLALVRARQGRRSD